MRAAPHTAMAHPLTVHKEARRLAVRGDAHHIVVRHQASRTIVVRHMARAESTHARDQYASSYYDYRSSSRVTETIDQRQDGMARRARRDDGYDRQRYSRRDAAGGDAVGVNPRDFNGGVGYGSDGGGYGGYAYAAPGGMNGRPIDNYGYHADAAGMARVRLNAWHGYNSHAGNGY